jgi:hypothetical protein
MYSYCWYWSDLGNTSAFSHYTKVQAAPYCSNDPALRSKILPFNFTKQHHERRGLISLFGDSQMRNPLNSIGKLAQPATYNPSSALPRPSRRGHRPRLRPLPRRALPLHQPPPLGPHGRGDAPGAGACGALRTLAAITPPQA